MNGIGASKIKRVVLEGQPLSLDKATLILILHVVESASLQAVCILRVEQL